MDNDIHDINNQLNLLTANVNYLSSYPVYYYNKLFEDNKQLNEEMESLKESNSNLRKRNFEQLDIIQQLENDLHGSNCSEDSVNNKNANKYEIKKYKKIKSSYDDDQINRLLRGIRNLKDIINLKSKWKYIKHNEILQCLYNIIPAVEKLNNMVGLENVKQIIFKKIVYFIRNRNNEEYLHTVISGPPGVGKTELAKIYADIFVRLGILKNNTFIEVKRDD